MYKNMEKMIVSLEEIAAGTINEELYQLCTSESDKVLRYENYIAKKLWTIVDKEQFFWGEYPEDFKEAVVNLIQNLFIFSVVGKNSVATGRKTSRSEKIDDYSISESYEHYSPYTFFGIPVDKETMEVIARYQSPDYMYGDWKVDLH